MLNFIDRLIAFFGRAAAWATGLLVVVIVIDVFLRFVFDLTAAWVVELEWHLFAFVFLLGAPYALQENRHVRVDLFYERFSKQEKGQVDFWGSLIFLIPWCLLLLFTGFTYAREAWMTGEGSPNPGGLPTFAPVKSLIPLAALLLLLQGIAMGVRAYQAWQETGADIPKDSV